MNLRGAIVSALLASSASISDAQQIVPLPPIYGQTTLSDDATDLFDTSEFSSERLGTIARRRPVVQDVEPTPVPAQEADSEKAKDGKDGEADTKDVKQLSEEDVERIIAAYMKEKNAPEPEKEEKEEKKKDEKKEPEKKDDEKKEKKWYEKMSFRGYTQVRFNQELFENDPSAPAHYVGDRSISENQSFFIRRARLIYFGDVNDYLYLYFQPDFAVTPPGSNDQGHFLQIRDLYADVYLDREKVFRFRVGQSKVPYGWENLQSSQNRLPLDRADSFNSAVQNERDLGVFFYYTPKFAQDFFKEVNDKNLKGSGNYGLFGIGAYNGQGGSFLETNDKLHVVSRLTLPHRLPNGQYLEAGIQGYIGEYTVPGDASDRDGRNERRLGASWIWYPQPIGFQAEWTVGRGPSQNEAQTAIVDRALQGGYAMLMGKWDHDYGTCFPFARWSYFEGGYRSQRLAPYADINEVEMGNEWQINKAAELTLAYLITDRTNTALAPFEQFNGHVLRCQFQFNY